MVILTSQYEQQVGTLYFEFSQFILSSSLLLLKSGRRRNQHMILMVFFRFLSWSESFRNQIMTILSKHGALESCPWTLSMLCRQQEIQRSSLVMISCFSNFVLSNAAAAFQISDSGSFLSLQFVRHSVFFNCLIIPFFRYAYLWLEAYGGSSTFGKFCQRSKCFFINISPLDVMTYILVYKKFSVCNFLIFFFPFCSRM